MIIDFGLDRLSTMLSGARVVMADPVLMAPELEGGKMPPDEGSDLFTLGQLCYIALVGGHPYAGMSMDECAQAYRDGGLPHLNTYVQGVQEDFADWVMWLVGTQDGRPSTSDEAMKALYAITLNEPEPNVPGETQAVEVPPPIDPHQAKISEPIVVEQDTAPKAKSKAKSKIKPKPARKAKPKQKIAPLVKQKPTQSRRTIASAHQPSERRVLRGSIFAVVGLLAILSVILVIRDDGSTSSTTAQPEQERRELATLGEVELFNQLLPMDQPQVIQLSSNILPRIKICDSGRTESSDSLSSRVPL